MFASQHPPMLPYMQCTTCCHWCIGWLAATAAVLNNTTTQRMPPCHQPAQPAKQLPQPPCWTLKVNTTVHGNTYYQGFEHQMGAMYPASGKTVLTQERKRMQALHGSSGPLSGQHYTTKHILTTRPVCVISLHVLILQLHTKQRNADLNINQPSPLFHALATALNGSSRTRTTRYKAIQYKN
jgi:hypothetical protein